jgi:NurA-like 5'-3' nuclease
MLIKINKVRATIEKFIQKIITPKEINMYPITNNIKLFFDLKPSRAATAPSKEPCGTPIKETKQRAIRERVLNSYIIR